MPVTFDELVSNNANATAALRTAIDENAPLQGFLNGMGYDISGLFDQLEQVDQPMSIQNQEHVQYSHLIRLLPSTIHQIPYLHNQL